MSKMKFEEALKNLETIVSEMENNNLSLDDSLKKYEEGIKLIRLCSTKLDEAEKKIEILNKQEDGTIQKLPFESESAQPLKKKKLELKASENDEEGLLF